MIKFLGILDVLAAIDFVLLLLGFDGFLAGIMIAYLIIKALLFFNIASFIDLLSAGAMLFAVFGVTSIVSWFFVFWLFQKGLISVFS